MGLLVNNIGERGKIMFFNFSKLFIFFMICSFGLFNQVSIGKLTNPVKEFFSVQYQDIMFAAAESAEQLASKGYDQDYFERKYQVRYEKLKKGGSIWSSDSFEQFLADLAGDDFFDTAKRDQFYAFLTSLETMKEIMDQTQGVVNARDLDNLRGQFVCAAFDAKITLIGSGVDAEVLMVMETELKNAMSTYATSRFKHRLGGAYQNLKSKIGQAENALVLTSVSPDFMEV